MKAAIPVEYAAFVVWRGLFAVANTPGVARLSVAHTARWRPLFRWNTRAVLYPGFSS